MNLIVMNQNSKNQILSFTWFKAFQQLCVESEIKPLLLTWLCMICSCPLLTLSYALLLAPTMLLAMLAY